VVKEWEKDKNGDNVHTIPFPTVKQEIELQLSI
jgi:hypothetical protein